MVVIVHLLLDACYWMFVFSWLLLDI